MEMIDLFWFSDQQVVWIVDLSPTKARGLKRDDGRRV